VRVVELAKKGFYRGTRFFWVLPSLVQFGDQLTRDMTKKGDWGKGGSGLHQANRPIGVAEYNKRKFDRGTVGIAYQNGYKPETADCQMFILKVPNPAMTGKYAAIGRVIKGMEVVDKLEAEDMIKDVSVR
jgi:cyclophilin family peptidyl-prolyl cis-trans isomerase